MKGAEHAKLFKTGQYGKLYIVSGEHARGKTLHVQILPSGEVAIPNGSGNLCLNKNAIEVYGVITGNPGWSEQYGWLHQGKWQKDFEKLVKKAELEEARKLKKNIAAIEKAEREKKLRDKKLLSKY